MSDFKLKVGQSDLLCRNGCGFYGNPEWSWYCSQCWRKQNSNIQSYKFENYQGSLAPGAGPGVSSGLLGASPGAPQSPGPGSAFGPAPPSLSQSLPAPLNKERVSPFASMMRNSPGLERKLKLPSPHNVAAGITNKMNQTKRLHAQTLDRSSSNIRQIFRKSTVRKDEKADKPEPMSTEAKLISKEFGEFLSARTKKAGMADLSRNIQNFVDKVNKRVEIIPIEDVAAMVQNFYQALTKRLETHENFQDLSQDDIRTISDYTERYMMVSLYKQLFSPVSTGDEEKDLEIQAKIRSLNWVTACHLDCPFRETDPAIRDLIYTAINHVLEIDGSKAPQDKLTSVVACAKTIFSILCAGGKDAASADDFLPALIYILMKANPPRVTSNINFITRFTNEQRLRSGEEGYYFTNLCCAIAFIENLTAESLSIPQAEFNQYMSGESIPPGSWESSLLMCEGIQTMSHNLKTLSELTEQQERILAEAEQLQQEMEDWEGSLRAEVEVVLARTQYTIRGPMKPAAVDSGIPEDISLPPPLLPQLVHTSPSLLRHEFQSIQTSPDSSEEVPKICSDSLSNFLQERSLIDETPTEELLLPTPLLPVLTTSPSSTPEPRPFQPSLSNYVGFSAQSFSIPSISCSTAETESSPPLHQSTSPLQHPTSRNPQSTSPLQQPSSPLSFTPSSTTSPDLSPSLPPSPITEPDL